MNLLATDTFHVSTSFPSLSLAQVPSILMQFASFATYLKTSNVIFAPQLASCRSVEIKIYVNSNSLNVAIQQLPNQDSCSKWTLCVNGRELQQECAAGTWFDRKLGTCDLSENVFCETDTCGNLAGGVGLAPSPNECDSYFYCYNGTKLSKGRCRPGLAFDNLTKRCVRAENVDCFPGARLLPANLPVAPTSLSSRG